MAGVSRLQYSTDIRLIRVMCSGRVDLEFIFRAFSNGTDGVLIGGCRLDECNYITHGNYDALSNVLLCKKILARMGLNPERLKIEFMSSGDGILLAERISDYCKKVAEIGPLGKSEGIDENGLTFKLEAVTKLIPYVKLVEREKLRVPVKSEEAYYNYFSSDTVNRLLDELIIAKLEITQMMLLLQDSPLTTGEMAETLGLNPSEVSRLMNSSSRHGWVRYDENRKRYALA
jgi:coenzyme F420-reducing hydrogenase delta subunit